jgi:hypothetical protein
MPTRIRVYLGGGESWVHHLLIPLVLLILGLALDFSLSLILFLVLEPCPLLAERKGTGGEREVNGNGRLLGSKRGRGRGEIEENGRMAGIGKHVQRHMSEGTGLSF